MKIGVTTVSFSGNRELVYKLKQTGHDIKINSLGRRLTNHELIEFLGDCDSAIIGLDKINQSVLSKCPKLKLISKYGVGLDNIDFSACSNYSVEVKYSIGINKRSVSEMALTMMIGLTRNIFKTSIELKSGIWNKFGGYELSGKNIGIIGYGNIGKDLTKLLGVFNTNVFLNDINELAFKKTPKYARVASLEEIFSQCDVISVHTPLTPKTLNLINHDNLSKLKDGVVLINTARGGIFNLNDVQQGLIEGKIGGLGVDAYEVEPPVCKELLSLPNVICTPHIGGNSAEAVKAMGEAAIKNLLK